jgi:arylsulfatase A-like enzyme
MVQKFPVDDLPGHSAWLDGDWKLHRVPRQKGASFEYELYNLAADRKESRNIAAEHPDRVSALRQALQAWQLSVVGSLNGEDYSVP